MQHFRLKFVMSLCWLFILASQCFASNDSENLINPTTWEVSPAGAAVVSLGTGKTTIMRQDCPLLKIDVKNGSKIRLSQTIQKDVSPGNSVNFHFSARSPSGTTLKFGYESKAKQHQFPPSLYKLKSDWRECLRYYDINGSKTGESSVYIEADGSFEMKESQVIVMKSPASSAYVVDDAQLDNRIQIHRTEPILISVKDKTGKPVAGVHVKIQQIRHQFLFGYDFSALGENEHLRKTCADVFNLCSLPLAWKDIEPKMGQSNFYELDRTVAWCGENQMAVMMSPLISDLNYPSWAPNDEEHALAALRVHIFNCVKHFTGTVKYWEVYVSPLTPREIPKRGYGSLLNQAGGDIRLLLRGLQWARLADQSRQSIFIYTENDFLHLTATLDAINQSHVMPDAIGIQFKMGSVPIKEIADQCKNIFRTYRIPIHITVTNSGDVDPKKLKELYRLFFSSPELQSLTWSDSTYRQKVQDQLKQLIRHDWWTSKEGVTDDKGLFETRAFFGDYAITATSPNGKIKKANFVLSPGLQSPKQLNLVAPE
jgi:hypothetical protein